MTLLSCDPPVRTAAKGTWTITIDRVPPSGNVTMRMHWQRYRKLLHDWYYLIRSAPGFVNISRPTGKRWVLIIRHGRKPMDRENRFFSMKPVIDVLRPPRSESGIYKTGKRQGQPWSRERIGHGLILDDDEIHLDEHVIDEPLGKGKKPYLTIIISDSEIAHE